MSSGAQRARVWARLRRVARDPRVTRWLAIGLTAAALASGGATYALWTQSGPEGPDADAILILLNIDLVLLLSLGVVVSRRLVHLWSERRRGLAGARLHARLVALFGLVAITPTIVVAVFSATFFNFGLDAWFSDRVRTALGESKEVAQAYYEEHRQNIRAEVLAMSRDIARSASKLLNDQRLFNRFLESQAELRSLTEAMVFTGDGRIIARSGLAFSITLEPISLDILERAALEDAVILDSDNDDRVRALTKLDTLADAYLVVGRFVDARVLGHVARVTAATDEYVRLEGRRSGLTVTFALIYVVVALLLLFAAIWVGLIVATQLATPIGELMVAAERVRSGDLGARVPGTRADDEIGRLGRSFNRMTDQLEAQRRELMEANRQIDSRRRFTESVLSGVSAGVIGLDADTRIELPNRSALRLLGLQDSQVSGHGIAEVFPEIVPLLDEARRDGAGRAEDQIEVQRGRRTLTLFVRVARERQSGVDEGGFVVTFDDVSALVAAQRTAAWADVARRIAHEIKNPLTPIQLSAERLKRRYLRQITIDPETFTACTDTIVRQVTNLGRMVDEFSTFARLPAPTFAEENVTDLVNQAVVLQEIAHPTIVFARRSPPDLVVALCDGRQIMQVLTNLLQNAVDAIEARPAPADGTLLARGRIEASLEVLGSSYAIEVVDNGRGLPQGRRESLTEPYVTTRAKGTGLGLAIVHRIVQDHGGVLTLDDASGGGGWVRVVLRSRAGDGAEEERPLTGQVGV
ncbi:MAG: PAS domain-containing sensor histidine kinase [Alphaproteobacteria bacterium]